jgi:hypothetical protein
VSYCLGIVAATVTLGVSQRLLMTSEFLATSVILLGLETYVEVIFDWLMSPSKLQSCLKLCQFAQSFLSPELQDRKHIPLSD